jgi:hypothetical protein
MKSLLLVAIILSTLVLTGCPKSKPNVPPAIAQRLANYELNRFTNDLNAYDCAAFGFITDTEGGKGGRCPANSKDDAQARQIRDRVIDRLKTNIDANYQDFENQLFTGRAKTNILFDIVDLGSTVAATITNGERAKTIISAALTGVKGGRKSIDENVFRERTTQAIISQMQTSRARVETTILQNKRTKGIDEYSLDEALNDLINYFYAGSLQKGLQDLAQEAGQDAVEAKAAVQREKLRAGTKARAEAAVSARDRFNALFKDALTPPIDLEKQAEAIKIAKQALKELTKEDPDPNIKTSDLFTALDAAMEKAAESEDGLNRVRKALGLPEVR